MTESRSVAAEEGRERGTRERITIGRRKLLGVLDMFTVLIVMMI